MNSHHILRVTQWNTRELFWISRLLLADPEVISEAFTGLTSPKSSKPTGMGTKDHIASTLGLLTRRGLAKCDAAEPSRIENGVLQIRSVRYAAECQPGIYHLPRRAVASKQKPAVNMA